MHTNKYFPVLLAALAVLLPISTHSLHGDASKTTVTVCHTPTDPDVTMEVLENAVNGHLNHDDYLGACSGTSSSSSDSVASSAVSSSSDSVASSAVSSADSSVSDASSSSASEVSSSSSSVSSVSTVSSESSSSSSSDNGTLGVQPITPAPSNNEDHNGGGSGGGGNKVLMPIFRGHGLTQHASAVDFILSAHDLQPNSVYSFGNEMKNPEPILSAATTSRVDRKHAAACSMFRYFQQLQVVRPTTPDDYIDWMSAKLADALGEDPRQMEAALLGLPPIHPHEDQLLSGISDQGCAANEYIYVPAVHVPSDHAAAPNNGSGSVSSTHDEGSGATSHVHGAEEDKGNADTGFHVRDESTDTELIFSIMKDDEIFRQFGSNLSHEMHLVIIRDDMQYFYHIHPDRDQLGTWHIPFAPAAGGTYWIYMNFTDRTKNSYGLRFTRAYPGGGGETAEILDYRKEKILDEVHFRVEPATTKSGMSFTYTITDDSGHHVHPKEFMGAFGHQIIVAANGYFNHSHPSIRIDGDPVFYTETMPAGNYVIFVSFDIADKEFTLAFHWTREQNSSGETRRQRRIQAR